ncbi:MAG: C40 family peptidase [Muribaculaceae bacterium]|nr:C40 family peptidase [Muribaculaceae bacterium]
MFQTRRLLKTVFAFFVTLLILTGCHSSRKFASDPIYDMGRYRTETRKSTPQKQTSPAVESRSSSKLNPSASALVAEAKKWIGTPYRYGGHSKSGTDCSGFIMEVFRAGVGIELPRTSKDQHKNSTRINANQLEVGDLVFFATGGSNGGVSHVGLYIGDNNMIHASTSRGVMISGLGEKYWVKTYHSAGRVAKFKNMTSKTPSAPVSEPRETKPIQTAPAPTPAKTTQSTPVKAEDIRDAVKSKVKEKVKKTVKDKVKKEVKKQADTKAKRAKSKPVKNAKAQPIQSNTPPKNAVEVSHTDLDKILKQNSNDIFD